MAGLATVVAFMEVSGDPVKLSLTGMEDAGGQVDYSPAMLTCGSSELGTITCHQVHNYELLPVHDWPWLHGVLTTSDMVLTFGWLFSSIKEMVPNSYCSLSQAKISCYDSLTVDSIHPGAPSMWIASPLPLPCGGGLDTDSSVDRCQALLFHSV